MSERRHHRSVYIPAPLDAALNEHPEINVSQVCKVALEVATGLIKTPEAESPGELSGTMSSKLSDIEGRLRTNISTLEKIARLAAIQANMIILTEEEAKTYRQILDVGVAQFIFRTKRDAIEEYKIELAKSAPPRKRRNKAEKLTTRNKKPTDAPPVTSTDQETQQAIPEQKEKAPQPATCVDCGDKQDIVCRVCGAPLCWICWTGPNVDAPARETCQRCTDKIAVPATP
jgi:hypothetical protein